MPTVAKWSFLGQADVYIDGRLVGNTLSAQLTGNEQVISQRDYRVGKTGAYASVRRLDNLELALTLADHSPDNLLALQRGTQSSITAGAITDESITSRASLDTLIRSAYMIDTSVAPVVTSDPAGTTYDVDDDYQVTPSGIYALSTGAIPASTALLLDYTKKASKKNEAYTAENSAVQVIIDGINVVDNKRYRITFHSCEMGIATARSLASADAIAELPMAFNVNADTTITTSSLSQYFVEELADAA